MKTPVYVWRFKSASGSGVHETLKYNDGSTSCSCPGWCKRIAPDGSRSCKHTRMVGLGVAHIDATSHGAVGSAVQVVETTVTVTTTTKVVKPSTYSRKFT